MSYVRTSGNKKRLIVIPIWTSTNGWVPENAAYAEVHTMVRFMFDKSLYDHISAIYLVGRIGASWETAEATAYFRLYNRTGASAFVTGIINVTSAEGTMFKKGADCQAEFADAEKEYTIDEYNTESGTEHGILGRMDLWIVQSG